MCSVVATLLAIVAYQIIPPRVSSIYPSENWQKELFLSYEADSLAITEWDNKSNIRFKCRDDSFSPKCRCGINFFYGDSINNGMDISAFNKIRVKARLTGEADQAILFLRNFNAVYSSVNDANSAKYLYLNFDASELKSNDVVEFNYEKIAVAVAVAVAVADWWKYQYKLDHKQWVREFSNVATMGIDLSYNKFDANGITLELENIALVGPRIKKNSGIWGY